MSNSVFHSGALEFLESLDDDSVNLILIDPPYGVTTQSWDSQSMDLSQFWYHFHRVLSDNRSILVFGSQPYTSQVIMSNLSNYRDTWYWIKKSIYQLLSRKKTTTQKC